jgi:hypothetical protein
MPSDAPNPEQRQRMLRAAAYIVEHLASCRDHHLHDASTPSRRFSEAA